MSSVRPIIILGCQRSGTTLLGQILGAHRDAVLIDEGDGSTELLRKACRQGALDPATLLPGLIKARAKYRDDERVDAAGRLAPRVTHVVIKAPNLTYEVDGLRRLSGQPCILFAVRDVRDVVSSMARLPHVPMIANQLALMRSTPAVSERFAAEIEQLQDESIPPHVKRAIIWKVKTSYHSEFSAAGIDALTVRYESLVEDPQAWRQRLFEHAGLDPAHATNHEDVMRGIGPGFTMRGRPVDDASAQRWKRTLSDTEEQQVWDQAQPLMDELGYERQPKANAPCKALDEQVLTSPVIATGRGGSGTRLLSLALQQLGVFLGNRLNGTADSIEWVDLIYEMVVKSGLDAAPRPPDWTAELRARATSILVHGSWQPGMPWGWKLPESMLVVPELADGLPGSKFIHLVRDPLDTCLRRTHMTSRADNPVGRTTLATAYAALGWQRDPAADPDHIRNAASWWLQVSAMQRHASTPGIRCLELRYEDLCTQPQHTADRIAAYLDIPERTVDLPVDEARRCVWTAGDARAAEVWRICGDVAAGYGYSFNPTD